MSDGLYGYVHFSNDNQAIFSEEWKEYLISYDDIDTTHLMEATANIFPQFLFEEDEDGAIPLNSLTLGMKVHKNRSLLKLKIWTDLALDNMRSISTTKKLPDATILSSLHFDQREDPDVSLGDFLSNGYNADVSRINLDTSGGSEDIWLNVSSEFPGHNTFSNIKMRSNSSVNNPNVVQTPRVGRTRQTSQDKFQTPITRIVR